VSKSDKKIYKITNNVNGLVYIGCSSDVSKRKYAHKKKARDGLFGEINRLYPAIRKFGWENFSLDVIEKCTTEDAPTREMFWIEKTKSSLVEFGYNTSNHGRCGDGKYWLGKKRPDISRRQRNDKSNIAKAVDATRKKVLVIETGKTYRSITELAGEIGRTVSAVAYAVRKQTKCAGITPVQIN